MKYKKVKIVRKLRRGKKKGVFRGDCGFALCIQKRVIAPSAPVVLKVVKGVAKINKPPEQIAKALKNRALLRRSGTALHQRGNKFCGGLRRGVRQGAAFLFKGFLRRGHFCGGGVGGSSVLKGHCLFAGAPCKWHKRRRGNAL